MCVVFPWGDRNPEGGFQVGDYVGLIHSDHDDYIFDNPSGVVTHVEKAENEDDLDRITVQVDATVSADLVFLIDRHVESDGVV